MENYNKDLKIYSQQLRKNSTDAERLLWSKIRRQQLKSHFYRQKPIGNYIADFYCPSAKLIIEIDGGQHYEQNNIKADKIRERYFNRLNLKILRFTNLDILKNIDNVIFKIMEEIKILLIRA